MKNITCTLLIFSVFVVSTFAQSQVGIPFKVKNGFILQIDGNDITVDVLDKKSKDDQLILTIDDNTQIVTGKKDKPVAQDQLRVGVQIGVEGEKVNSKGLAQIIEVKTDLNDWKVKLSGVYEKYENGVATIDGQQVKLAENIAINGTKGWKKKQFSSFDEMMLGAFVDLKGKRGEDGMVYVEEGTTYPNTETKADKNAKLALDKGVKLTIANNLAGGKVKIGEESFKLVEDFEIQAYVNKVGSRVIPEYLLDMPEDAPGHVTFKFYVIENESFNAFAYPDGSVFVHTGLLKALDNEAQLAAVLSHEIAHVTHEHGSDKYKKEQRTGKVTNVAKNIVAINRRSKGKQKKIVGTEDVLDVGANLLSNSFSQKMEKQADKVGLFYMREAGYDIREAAEVWKKLAEINAQKGFFDDFAEDMEEHLDEHVHTNPDGSARADVTNLAESGKETFKTKLAGSIYGSHPAAKRRLKNLNRNLALNYADTDYSQLKTGEKEYKEFLVLLK